MARPDAVRAGRLSAALVSPQRAETRERCLNVMGCYGLQFPPVSVLLLDRLAGLVLSEPARLKHVTLTAVSYVFYGWANPLFVVLMFISTLIDYVCGLALVGRLRPATWRDPIPLLLPHGPRTRHSDGYLRYP